MTPEFPSDNQELWCARPPPWNEETEPEAAAEPESAPEPESESVTATEPESAPEPEPVAVPPYDVADFDDADFALAEEESRPAEAAPDAFQRFVSTVVAVALAAGVPARVAAAIPGMVGAARLDVQPLDPETLEALVAASLLARTDSGAVTRSPALVANAQAWRATLLGEETDLPVTEMLDEWSAGMVAALAKLPQQKESLRRELRARGIAAFGMLDAA